MSVAQTPFGADIRAVPAFRSAPWPLIAAAALMALACALQTAFGAFGDVSWMLTIGEKWLAGGAPYVDFVETNPPAAIALYLPAVEISRLTGLRAEAAVAAMGLAGALASLAYARSILRRGAPAWSPGPVASVIALAGLAVLPGRTFDERDFFVALLMLPALALWTVRAGGVRPAARDTVICGLLIAAALAVKPPYATIPLVAAPYLWRRTGLAKLLRCGEFWLAGLAFALYVAAVFAFFPAYFQSVAPTLAIAYLPVRESIGALFANSATVGVLATLAVAAFLLRGRILTPSFAIPALAALGGLLAFFIQGKGWLYQALPAAMFAAVLAGLALEARALASRRLALAAAAAALTFALGAFAALPPLPLAFALAALAHFAAAPRGETVDARIAGIAEMFLAALVGALAAFYAPPFPGPTAAFKQALREIGPHPRIAAIAPGLGAGFPLTRQVDGDWVLTRQGLLMAAGARVLLSRAEGDRAALEKVIEEDRTVLAADLSREKPDAILVSRSNPALHDWIVNDPDIAAVLAGYRLAASNDGKDWPLDLYRRKWRAP